MADNFRSDRSRGPIADLARLISEVYGERAHAVGDFGEETARLAMIRPHLGFPGPSSPSISTDQAHDVEGQRCAADERYQNEVPRVRRRSLTLVMAITGLALAGTAGAFGYRDIFGGSVLPTPSRTST